MSTYHHITYSRFGETDPNYHEFTYGKTNVFVVSTLTMRGWSCSPSTSASRTAFICLLYFGMFTYWHWEAMLISYLATRVIVLPFNDLRGLVEESDFRIALIPGSSYEDAFKTSTNPLWQRAWTEKLEPYLEEYVPFQRSMITIPSTQPTTALYDNYFAVV